MKKNSTGRGPPASGIRRASLICNTDTIQIDLIHLKANHLPLRATGYNSMLAVIYLWHCEQHYGDHAIKIQQLIKINFFA